MWLRRYSNISYPFENQNYVGFNGVGEPWAVTYL